MLCSKCHKRPAVIFFSIKNKKNTKPYGICEVCANIMGIKSVEEIMKSLNITEKDLNEIQEQVSNILSSNNVNMDVPVNDSEEGENGFVPGGAATFPFIKAFFSNMPLFENGFKEFPKFSNVKDNEKNNNNSKTANEKKKLKRRFINLYCDNLTQKAQNNEIDRIVGRERELARTIQILCRRTKNNPCLIGEPGVGKTAIAEGLALKIAEKNVPLILKKKEIHLLDLTALIAGTQFRGQFENRIKGLIEEIKKDGNIILFIDEAHNLIGAGDSEGSMSAANILKPALSRGEIQVIGATTYSEYRKYIEKDAALERRFQTIKISEPSIEETAQVLNGIKFYYENYHRVLVSDELVKKIVILSERYITDRFLPDKAIDLLDESCACATLNNKFLIQYDNVNLSLENLKTEEEKLLAANLEENYEQLAEIRCEIAKKEKELQIFGEKALKTNVTEQDIAQVIELWTGISSAKVQANEFKKLAFLDEKLKEKIVGQEIAINEITAAIRRNKVQISPRRRPTSFIFVGPTGVGKTELVKVLSHELFSVPDALIRLDMSEYMEKHSVSRIIGTPPGYVGYDEPGQITEKVRQRPYSVLLFDEIEKAHPDVLNILLQILDEGKITDSHGRIVNFENTVIVMTSNAGSEKKDGAMGFAKSQNELTKEKTMKALNEFLRPEFISRLDEIVIFNNLTEEHFAQIAKLILNEYTTTLAEHKIIFSYDETAVKVFAEKTINDKNGVRSLRNLIRKVVEDKIAESIVTRSDYNIGNVFLTKELNLIFSPLS